MKPRKESLTMKESIDSAPSIDQKHFTSFLMGTFQVSKNKPLMLRILVRPQI